MKPKYMKIGLLFCTLCLGPGVIYPSDNLPDMGNSADTLLSPEDEKRLGQEFMRSVRRSLKLVTDPVSSQYIQSLGEKLASQVDTQGQTFTFFIVQNDTINAFAGPAGFIGVHTGLIQSTNSEGELASVMAHEIAHVIQRHLVRSVKSGQNMSLAALGAIIAGILIGQSQGNAEVSQAVIASTIAGATQSQLSFSRAHEQEADRVGIDMLAHAGYNPQEMADFFEVLDSQNRIAHQNIPEFLLTHPVTSSRIADARGRAQQYAKDNNSRLSQGDQVNYELIKARLTVLTSDKNKISQLLIAQQQSKDKQTEPGKYEQALRYQKLEQYTKAEAILVKLVEADHERIPYLVALAENQLRSDRSDVAEKTLSDALTLYPGNQPLTVLYVEALVATNKAEQATLVLEKHIRQYGATPMLYKLLSTTADKAGKPSEAYEALANFYYLFGETRRAISYLQQALAQKDIDQFSEIRIKARLNELKKDLEVNPEQTEDIEKDKSFDKV